MKERKKNICNPGSGGYKNPLHGCLCFLLNTVLLTHTSNSQLSESASTLYLPVPWECLCIPQRCELKTCKASWEKEWVQNAVWGQGWLTIHKPVCMESSLLHPRACTWGHVLKEQKSIGLRHPLHSVEAQRAPAAAQETPGMCLCPYKSFWLALLCEIGSGCRVWQSLHLAELFATCSATPEQADCNNTGYLLSCASPVCPGEKRYVLASLITSFFAGVNKRSHRGLSLLVRFCCAQGLLQETASL